MFPALTKEKPAMLICVPFEVTVIALVSVKFPSCVLPVIIVVPTFKAVTNPFEFTVATYDCAIAAKGLCSLRSRF